MKRMQAMAVGLIAVAMITAPVLGGVVVTQQGPAAPTYGTTLDFDEPGGPVGAVDAGDWAISHGVTSLAAGDGFPIVADHTGSYGPWVGTANSYLGNFGVTITFDTAVTEFSTQAWDPGGEPTPFGGGLGFFVFDGATQVAGGWGEMHFPAWGGVGDEWFDVTTDSGSTFDKVQVFGNGWDAWTFVDNMSWNAVPEPSSLSLLGLAGVAVLRRRRK